MNCERIKLWDDNDYAYLETYILKNSMEYKTGEKRPLVIICPGGAYMHTTDREAEPVAMRFLSLGYHAAVLRYNTHFNGIVMDRKNPPPGNEKSAYPYPLYDLAKAMLTIRAHAESWFVDCDRIVLCGFSAGGHLAASMGVHWQDDFLKQKFDIGNDELKPGALILGYPLTDHHVMKQEVAGDSNKAMSAFNRIANKAGFGTEEPTDEELRNNSPVNFVSTQTPPTFLWHTANDGSVYVANSLNFASKLTENKVPYELHIFESGVHGLSLCDETSAAKENQIEPDCRIWFDLAATWLKKHVK